jgi:hypothetical protein
MLSGFFKGKYDCTKCKINKNFPEVWGCNGTARMAIPTFEWVENNIHYKLRSCPRRFIPASVEKFYMIYKYYFKDFPTAPMPGIHDVSLRFLTAYRAFNNFKHEYEEVVNERHN